MAERDADIVDAIGSIPITPTITPRSSKVGPLPFKQSNAGSNPVRGSNIGDYNEEETTMKIGFTGTRYGMRPAQAHVFGILLVDLVTVTGSSSHTFRHGMCRGADYEAGEIAFMAVEVIGHPGPDNDVWRHHGCHVHAMLPPMAHLARNREIVDKSEILIAAPAEMVETDRGGTWSTIRYARKAGKKITIIYPDGSLG